MLSDEQHHIELIDGINDQMKEILDGSEQAIYIYLDDNHKVCNRKFASLIGAKSEKEWASMENPFMYFVAENSQETLADAYQNAIQKGIGSSIKVTWKKISGGTVDTDVILVPIAFQKHIFALHFVS